MKLLTLLTTALLPLTALAAKKSAASTDAFAKFHAQAVSAGSSLKLEQDSYDTLTAAPRNHSVAVLFTALEARFGCQVCQMFQPEWDLLARSWVRGDRKGESKIVFATLDFVDAKKAFEQLGLNTAPILVMYRPTTGPDAVADAAPLKLDFATGIQTAESLHSWISRNMPESAPKPSVHRPFNWLRFISITTLALGGLTGTYVAWPYLAPILLNRNLWAAGCMIAILLFTSGHMFNHIRSTPYVSADGNGGLVYFAPGFQNQLGMESQLVAAIYGVLAFATISLALRVPRMTDEKTQQVAVLVWGALIFGVYSLLLSVFRVKNGGYPFWLPPF